VTLRSNYAGCQANRKIVRMGGAARLLAPPSPGRLRCAGVVAGIWRRVGRADAGSLVCPGATGVLACGAGAIVSVAQQPDG